MTRRYPNKRPRRPTPQGMNVLKAKRLAEAGHVDTARRIVAEAPPGVVVIEVNNTVPLKRGS